MKDIITFVITGLLIYSATTHWQVDQLAVQNVKPGQIIAVKIDANKLTTIFPEVL